jgi:hypothetical protein
MARPRLPHLECQKQFAHIKPTAAPLSVIEPAGRAG